MKNIPILGKVLAVVGIFALFVVAATAFATHKMQVIDATYSDLSDQYGTANVLLARSSRAVWGMRGSIVELLISNSDEGNKTANKSLSQQYADFTSYMDRVASLLPDQGSRFADLKQQAVTAVDRTCAEAIKLGQATDKDGILRSQAVFLKDCAPALSAVASQLRSAVDELLTQSKAVNDATSDVTVATIRLTWAMILGGLALVLVGAFLCVRLWISKPLTVLAASMSAIAEGDFRAEIAGVERKDEVGVMARVAEAFKRPGEEKIALEAEAVEQRRIADVKREQDEAARKRIADEQMQVVNGLAAGLAQLAGGDLVFRLEQPFAQDYEKLRLDFNAAIAKLQDAMTVITGTTSAIRSGTVEISSAADDLSRRTEQQAASLEETAAALDQITATVKKTADGASNASTVVSTAKADAEQSGLVVGRAVEAMSAIETSSQKIGQIIGVIDEIAFQTNLLALNAGVEAARAGEAGRGFAVVASEVRALAQRSAEAAKEIKALISTSAKQVGDGVELVGETGEALRRIVDQVAQIATIVTDIAASAQEQSAGLEQVNTAINQMDQVTQQNAAMVEETTAASRNLAGETDELSRLVGQFRVGGAVASSRPVVRHQAPAKSVTAMKVTGRGGAALRAAPQTASWEEF